MLAASRCRGLALKLHQEARVTPKKRAELGHSRRELARFLVDRYAVSKRRATALIRVCRSYSCYKSRLRPLCQHA